MERIFHGAKGAKEEDQETFLCDLCGLGAIRRGSDKLGSLAKNAKHAKEEDQESILCRLGAKNFLVPGAGIEPARTFRSPGF